MPGMASREGYARCRGVVAANRSHSRVFLELQNISPYLPEWNSDTHPDGPDLKRKETTMTKTMTKLDAAMANRAEHAIFEEDRVRETGTQRATLFIGKNGMVLIEVEFLTRRWVDLNFPGSMHWDRSRGPKSWKAIRLIPQEGVTGPHAPDYRLPDGVRYKPATNEYEKQDHLAGLDADQVFACQKWLEQYGITDAWFPEPPKRKRKAKPMSAPMFSFSTIEKGPDGKWVERPDDSDHAKLLAAALENPHRVR